MAVAIKNKTRVVCWAAAALLLASRKLEILLKHVQIESIATSVASAVNHRRLPISHGATYLICDTDSRSLLLCPATTSQLRHSPSQPPRRASDVACSSPCPGPGSPAFSRYVFDGALCFIIEIQSVVLVGKKLVVVLVSLDILYVMRCK